MIQTHLLKSDLPYIHISGIKRNSLVETLCIRRIRQSGPEQDISQVAVKKEHYFRISSVFK
jgi:hypothetical protein